MQRCKFKFHKVQYEKLDKVTLVIRNNELVFSKLT